MPLVLTDITPVEGGQAYATLTLNNPDERNTLTAPMVAEIIAAMDALATMKAKDGYDGLYRIAMDDTAEPFINKKAIMALGELGDARAVPGLVKRMFTERKGISFYMESSFALYQIGQPAADAVYPIVGNEDPELIKWAESNNIKPVALPLKASQVVGDFHDMRAEKALIGMLNAKVDFDDIKLLMRMKAADALGRGWHGRSPDPLW